MQCSSRGSDRPRLVSVSTPLVIIFLPSSVSKMGCTSSQEVASGTTPLESKEEDHLVHHDRATIRGGHSSRSSLCSFEGGASLALSPSSDSDVESYQVDLRPDDDHPQLLPSGVGIIPHENTLHQAPEFTENILVEELSQLQPLATGGFCIICSCVYRCEQVVVKVPRPDGPRGAIEDLFAEIHAYRLISARGGHANITRAIGAGIYLQGDQEIPFLILERLEGGTLDRMLDRSHEECSVWHDPRHRLGVALDIAEAISFLHNDVIPGGFILHR